MRQRLGAAVVVSLAGLLALGVVIRLSVPRWPVSQPVTVHGGERLP